MAAPHSAAADTAPLVPIDPWYRLASTLGAIRAEAIIDRVLTEAEKGRPWAARLIFERALPVAQRHQVHVEARPEPRSPLLVPTEEDERQLVEMLQAGGVLN